MSDKCCSKISVKSKDDPGQEITLECVREKGHRGNCNAMIRIGENAYVKNVILEDIHIWWKPSGAE